MEVGELVTRLRRRIAGVCQDDLVPFLEPDAGVVVDGLLEASVLALGSPAGDVGHDELAGRRHVGTAERAVANLDRPNRRVDLFAEDFAV